MDDPPSQIARPGENCWRVESAPRVGILIDAQNYYRALVDSLARAERSIAIVGWDVNTRARLFEEGEAPFPCEFGPLLDALAARRRSLHVWVLEWDFPMLYALDRELLPIVRFGWHTHRRVHFRLDSSHPLAGSHHQKLVVVDDKVAFVGGMDVTHARWDTAEHLPEDPRRIDCWGRVYPPYHDVQLVCDGPAAAALGALARERWRRAGGRFRRPVHTQGDPWPHIVKPDVERVELAIARTEPAYRGRDAVTEVARAWVDLIRTAQRSLYIENQYLTSGLVGDAMAESLARPDGPEIVVVITHASTGWLEEATMGVLRSRLLERLLAADPHRRLRVYYACAGQGVDVKIHAKVAIADDRIARVGSANLNNRSMGLDTECDVFFESHGRRDVADAIAALRDRLIAEHLGVAPEQVTNAIAQLGTPGAAIEALRGGERTLVPLDADPNPWMETVVPEGSLLDPERPVSLADLIVDLSPEDPAPLRGPLERALLLALVAAGVTALWWATPLSERRGTFGIDAWLASWRGHGIAPLFAAAAVALGGLSMAPLTLLVALCGFVLGPALGFASGVVGALVGAFTGYAIGNAMRRDTARRLAGRHLDRIGRLLQIGGLRAILAVRLLSLAPFGAVNLIAGATRFPWRPFALGTLLAVPPATLALVWLGHMTERAIAIYGSKPLAGATALALAASVALVALHRHLRARRAAHAGAA